MPPIDLAYIAAALRETGHAVATEKIREKCLEIGAVEYLIKSIDFKELLGIINNRIRHTVES